MQPDLALQYNSNGARNDDIFGYGWSVNIPYIQRLNKTGTENLYVATATQYFVSSLDGELATTSSSSMNIYGPRAENGDFRTYT
jgi:virulence plasmid B protein